MKKDVIIFFKSSQTNRETGDDSFEIITPGQYYFKNGKHYLLYDEVDENKGPAIHNTIRVSREQVEVIRNGQARIHMTFSCGERTDCLYETPFGQLMVGLITNDIEICLEEDKLEVILTYELEVENGHEADCEVVIRAESRETCRLDLLKD